MRWVFPTGDIFDTAGAVTDDGAVVAGSADGHVYSIDLRTGAQRWVFAAHHSQNNGAEQYQGKQCGRDWSGVGLLGPQGGPSNWFEGHVKIAPKGRVLVGSDNYRLYRYAHVILFLMFQFAFRRAYVLD